MSFARERPIIFSAPMVRAILEGRKTQTRRIVKAPHVDEADAWAFIPDRGLWQSGIHAGFGQMGSGEFVRCPYGVAGDRLWVRETFAVGALGTAIYKADLTLVSESRDGLQEWTKADREACIMTTRGDWRSPRFMPRKASRITLEVVAVRVERLSAITHEDALAEGFRGHDWVASSPYIAGPHTDAGELPAEEFAREFRALNKLAPDADPWVWVVEFKRVEAG